MPKYASYLVCKEYIHEVKDFLSMFFAEEKGVYNHETWITFQVPNSSFFVNLMEGSDQDITQNMVFEIYCDSKKQLEDFANKHNVEIQDFLSTVSSKNYRYNYIEILGPKNICKFEISYIEDISEV